MTNDQRYSQLVSALLMFVAAQAGHWLITPVNHPAASSGRIAAVWVQLVACACVSVWFWRRSARTAAKS